MSLKNPLMQDIYAEHDHTATKIREDHKMKMFQFDYDMADQDIAPLQRKYRDIAYRAIERGMAGLSEEENVDFNIAIAVSNLLNIAKAVLDGEVEKSFMFIAMLLHHMQYVSLPEEEEEVIIKISELSRIWLPDDVQFAADALRADLERKRH